MGKVLIDLFDVLDGKKLISKWRIIKSFKCVHHYMGIFEHALGCEELKRALIESDRKVEYCNIKHLEPSNISVEYLLLSMFSGPNMYSIGVDNIADFSKDKERIMRINSSKDNHVYNLKAILMFDEESCCFNTVYLKQEDGKWHRRSFDGIKKEPLNDDLIISMLGKQSKNVNLIYMKTC